MQNKIFKTKTLAIKHLKSNGTIVNKELHLKEGVKCYIDGSFDLESKELAKKFKKKTSYETEGVVFTKKKSKI